jgi:1,2-dihydroxy-3-keto-5-methylthiopentene dioxygenase
MADDAAGAAAAAPPPATADEAATATADETFANKKQKTNEDYPMAPDADWPEAWIMADKESDPDFDQCQPNRCEPNIPVSAPDLRKIGIAYWKMDDVDKYDYPVKAVPYDPKDAMDPKLAALRDSRGYSYADIITVHPDHLPEFDVKIKAFFEEVSV